MRAQHILNQLSLTCIKLNHHRSISTPNPIMWIYNKYKYRAETNNTNIDNKFKTDQLVSLFSFS